ncbi:MAG TPA: anhydro-N-acetylmuramic acid kinase [Puia sp.]|nr:anhydro-N-acetylmuramic acid kinase [Puia sp.]
MQYKVIGLMSGSSLDGLDIVYVHFEEQAGRWSFDIRESACLPYPPELQEQLAAAPELAARDYLLLHTEYGHYLGNRVHQFIEEKKLEYQVQLIASHGHTSFHMPEKKMTAQLGDGAAIAAVTRIHTITDLRSVDVALGGQGAPVVPIGEKLLFPDYDLFLNIGGIANISIREPRPLGFDVCPANRVLNLLAAPAGYDEDGKLAARGKVSEALLEALNRFDYYHQPFPKSLANSFGLDQVFPAIAEAGLTQEDALRTYVEHIVVQVARSTADLLAQAGRKNESLKMLVTGGGAHNRFLVERLAEALRTQGVEIVVPSKELVDYKEALIIALMGALRWRDEENVLSSVTGASGDSINGAIWSSR